MKAAPLFLLALGVVCLALAIADQLGSGTLYGEGSSLRTDREGASVYFEALRESTHRHAERTFVPMESLSQKGAAVLVLNLNPGELGTAAYADALTRIAKNGNRVVVSFDSPLRDVKIPAWAIQIAAPAQEDDDDEGPEYATIRASNEWTIWREEEGAPIALERRFGGGSIALVGYTHPFHNEALRDHRDLPLLDWAVGGMSTVVFDETHLGSIQNGTIMNLVRSLRLQGVLAALILASLLYFWKSGHPFPPVAAREEPALRIVGMSTDQALRNMLTRRIPPTAIVAACVEEWRRDFARKVGPDTVQSAIQASLEAAPPAAKWETIRRIIQARNT